MKMLTAQSALRKDQRTGVDTLQHRHFATIAAIIADMPENKVKGLNPSGYRTSVAMTFAYNLAGRNPRFDRARFLRACGVEARTMNKQTAQMLGTLQNLGISWDDAQALRRISITLHRWHEMACGDSNDFASWCITRGNKKDGIFTYDDNGRAFIERHLHTERKTHYERIADRERGALKRLQAIMAKYAPLAYYVQTDPRGASPYILRPGDVPAGATVDSCYSRGVAVYK